LLLSITITFITDWILLAYDINLYLTIIIIILIVNTHAITVFNKSEGYFTHLMTFRSSDINIHYRRVDGINQNLYFTISIRTHHLIVRFSILVNTRNIYMMFRISQTHNLCGIRLCAIILIHLQTLIGHVIRALNNNSQFGIIHVLGSHKHIHNIPVVHYSDTLFGFRFHNTNSLLQ